MTPAVTEGAYILLCFTGAAIMFFALAAVGLLLWDNYSDGRRERDRRRACPVCTDPNHFWIVRTSDPLCTEHKKHYEHIERLEENIYKKR